MALTKVTGHVVLPTTNIEFHNTKSTGIVTFTHTSNATSSTTGALQITGGVGIAQDLFVGGQLSVGGTITYEDVDNINSVGIITANAGIVLQDYIFHKGDTNTSVGFPSNDTIDLITAGTPRIRIASDGKIGINTTDATHQLTVFAKTANSTIARFKALNRNSNFDIITDASSHGSARVRNNIGATKIHLNSNGDSYFTGGDVGIGTASPATKLHVDGGNLTIRNGTAAGVILSEESGVGGSLKVTTATGTASFGPGNSTFCHVQTDRTGGFYFNKRAIVDEGIISSYDEDLQLHSPLNTRRVTIDKDDGFVGIGTDSPNALLHVEKNGSNQVLARFESNMGSNNSRSLALTSPTSDSSTLPFTFSTGNSIQFKCDTHVVHIDEDGKLGIGTDNVQSLLHLKGTGGNTSGLRFDNSHDNVSAYFQDNNDNSDFIITYSGTGGAELTIHADGNLGLNEANGDNVLIGTSTDLDNSKLTIKKAAAGLTTAIALGNGNVSGTGSKIIATKSLVLSADYDNNNSTDKSYLGFETDGTERLRIESDGTINVATTTKTSATYIKINANRSHADDTLGGILGVWNGNPVAGVNFKAGADTTNKDDGEIMMLTYASGTPYERLRITSTGTIGIGGTTIPGALLDLSSGQPGILFSETDVSANNGKWLNQANASELYWQAQTDAHSGGGNLFKMTRSNEQIQSFEGQQSGATWFTIRNSDKTVGIGTAIPSNQLHIAGTTGTAAGGLLRLDATTGDNFIIFDNTHDSTEWVIGNDSSARDEFRLYYNQGSGYTTQIVAIDGTHDDGKVTIDGGTNTLVNIRADSAGAAGLRLGGDSGQSQSTGFVEVHQDESHGGGFFYNGDGSPSFATGEAADYFSLFRLSGGTRHSVMRWFHSSNECHVQGDMLVDNGASTIIRVRGDNSGTAGISCGGGDGHTQCTGYVEVTQDQIHGGGISYNGDGNPAFVNNESADHVTFYRIDSGARQRVFHCPYNSSNVNFAGNIEVQGSTFNYNSGNTMRGYFTTATSAQTATNAPTLAGSLYYGYGYQEAYSTTGGVWTNPFPDLVLGYHTGVSLGGHPNYNGCRFFGDHPSVSSTVILSVGNGGGGVHVTNELTAGTKTFRIVHPHPSKKYTHDLVHSVIEGPQCDNIYRGKINLVGGTATVNIDTVSNMTDGTFVLLNRDIQCFTSNETGWTAVKGSVTGNILTITAQDNTCTDTISWMVVGERQDDKIKSVDTTDENGKLIMEPLTIEQTHM